MEFNRCSRCGSFYIAEGDVCPKCSSKDGFEFRTLQTYVEENGLQKDYFDNPNFIGWTREGDEQHIKSGLAVVISNAGDGEKRMYVGKKFAGERFIEAIGNCNEEIIIDENGFGTFKVKGKSVSVLVER